MSGWRGSRFEQIPGKMEPLQLKTAPGGAPTPVTPRPNPSLSNQPKGELSMSITVPGDDLYRSVLPTDSAAIAVTIGHLDFSPRCEGRAHKAPPPADFLVDLHGCRQKFGCAACVQADRDEFARCGDLGLQCECCGMWFYEFSRAITKVVAL